MRKFFAALASWRVLVNPQSLKAKRGMKVIGGSKLAERMQRATHLTRRYRTLAASRVLMDNKELSPVLGDEDL